MLPNRRGASARRERESVRDRAEQESGLIDKRSVARRGRSSTGAPRSYNLLSPCQQTPGLFALPSLLARSRSLPPLLTTSSSPSSSSACTHERARRREREKADQPRRRGPHRPVLLCRCTFRFAFSTIGRHYIPNPRENSLDDCEECPVADSFHWAEGL